MSTEESSTETKRAQPMAMRAGTRKAGGRKAAAKKTGTRKAAAKKTGTRKVAAKKKAGPRKAAAKKTGMRRPRKTAAAEAPAPEMSSSDSTN